MLGLQLLRLPSDAYVSHRGNAGSLTPHAAALSPDGRVKNQTCGGRRRSLPLLRRVETTGGRRKEMLTSLSASFNASLNTPRHGRGQREEAQRTERRTERRTESRTERKALGDICKMDVCTNVHLLKMKARSPVSVPASESDQTGLSRCSCCVSTDALSQLAEAFLQA